MAKSFNVVYLKMERLSLLKPKDQASRLEKATDRVEEQVVGKETPGRGVAFLG